MGMWSSELDPWPSLNWGKDGTKIHYGQKASRWRQSDALEMFCWETKCTPSFSTLFPNGSGLFQQDVHHYQILLRNSLRNMTNSLRCCLQIPYITICSNPCGLYWINSYKLLKLLTGRNGCHSTPSEDFVESRAQWVRVVLAAKGTYAILVIWF